MKDAFKLAYEVCLGVLRDEKRDDVKKVVVLITPDGRWNWPFNDPSPVSFAQRLPALGEGGGLCNWC